MSDFEKTLLEMIARFQCQIDAINAQAQARTNEIKAQRAAVITTLELYRRSDVSVNKPPPPRWNEMQGKSQHSVLVLLAERNGGLLAPREATEIMKQAGFFKNPDHGGAAIYAILQKSKSFEKVSRGLWRLAR